MLSLLMLAGECNEVRVVYWVQPFAHEHVGGIVKREEQHQQFNFKVEAVGGGVPQRSLPVLHVVLYP